jgi:hypothetical protein
MPEISRFYGIVIAMYSNDHEPPHFHAVYGEHYAMIAIADGCLLRGAFPQRALRLVRVWASAHRTELGREWRLARDSRPLFKIAPLV